MSGDPGKQARDRRYDRRRRQTSNVRHLYKTARWQRLRARVLAAPCKACREERGEIVPATHCDHRNPHRNDPAKFWTGPFDPLCDHCHNAKKQREEREGFSRAIGPDGWPVDDRHPFAAREKPE